MSADRIAVGQIDAAFLERINDDPNVSADRIAVGQIDPAWYEVT